MLVNSIFEKKTVLSFEIFPPKTDAPLDDAERLVERFAGLSPDFISVTFGAAGSAENNKTVEIAGMIRKKFGIESVVHLTCLNHDASEIRTILSELRAQGIENVLTLRGDKSKDKPPADVFFHASDLIRFVAAEGGFGISAACYPECHPETRDRTLSMSHLKEKVDAGARHLISQLFFDDEDFRVFLREVREAGIDAPIEAGVMPVTSGPQIERMAALCGARVPDGVRDILTRYADDKEALANAGVDYAIAQIKELLEMGADGIHLYTMNNPDITERIVDGVGRSRG